MIGFATVASGGLSGLPQQKASGRTRNIAPAPLHGRGRHVAAGIGCRPSDSGSALQNGGTSMKIGIASDHGGFQLKEDLVVKLRAAGHVTTDFGAHRLNPDDDYPDFVAPLAMAVATGEVERGIAICGSGVGASVCANKVKGVRAALIHDHFSARQGVEDDHMNILCMGGRTVGSEVAWDLVQAYLAADYSPAERHLRRLEKVRALENPGIGGTEEAERS